MHCKAKYTINLKPNPTLPNAGDLVLLPNLPRQWTIVCVFENRPFPLEYSTHRITNRMKFCKCSFSAGPNYLAQIILLG